MKRLRLSTDGWILGLLAATALMHGNSFVSLWAANPPAALVTPVEAVRTMVQVEKQARQGRTLFRYTSEERSSRTGGHLWRENVVETRDGLLRRLVAEDGKPLSAGRAAAEDRRIADLVTHPAALRAASADRRADEERIGRLLDILPKAFVWTADGMQGDCVRIAFKPNPDFTPSSYDERVIHGLAGTVLIRMPANRLCGIEGHLVDRISFGYGLLGHIEKDSHFGITRVPVTLTDWKNSLIDVHVDGRILLLKSISRDQDARHMDAQPLPPDLTLAEAAALTKP